MNERPDVHSIARALDAHAEAVAIALLGEPSIRGRLDLRFGRKGSLAVVVHGERRGLWHDHSADEGGDMIKLIRRELGGDTREACEWARRFLGDPGSWRPARTAPILRDTPQRWSERADQIWRSAMPLLGTLAERYLRARIGEAWSSIRETIAEADALRFLPARGDRTAAMVARITDAKSGEPMSLHFTRLRADGGGKADDGKPAKLLLSGHAKAGGVVRLIADENVTLGLGIAEGIETALSVIASGWAPVWAAVDAGNIAAFPALPGIEALTVFCDRDEAGMRAASACAARWRAAGREASIVAPGAEGDDWNDAAKRAAEGGR
jgi:putative DNA primase/helicase